MITACGGAVARTLWRSSVELTEILCGRTGAAGPPSPAAGSGAAGRPGEAEGSVKLSWLVPRLADSAAGTREAAGGLLSSRPHHASPEITTRNPSAGSSQAR